MLPSTYYMIRLQPGASQRGCAVLMSAILSRLADAPQPTKATNHGCLAAEFVFSMTNNSGQ